jgi:hypothetical protein
MVKEDIEELEEETVETKNTGSTNPEPKQIIIETTKSIIAEYKELMKDSNDEMLLKGFADESRSEEECVNYVMNNLVKNRIYGGRDSLMYPYIHDYYVDDLDAKQLSDNWSSQIRGGGSSSGQQVRVQKPTQKDIMEAYEALDNEKKNEIYQEQLKRAEEEAYKKAQAKIKEREEKKKEKERLKKEKEAEAKKLAAEKKAQEEANKPKQMSLFDF